MSEMSASRLSAGNGSLSVVPPLVWPEPRWHQSNMRYEPHPPSEALVESADLISGVLAGADDQTVDWVESLAVKEEQPTVKLVLVLYPAGPTREKHLTRLNAIQNQNKSEPPNFEIRILPVTRLYGSDFERMIFQPTVLQLTNTGSGNTTFCIGSAGNAGRDGMNSCSYNMVFQPDDGLRDHWRRWFQYVFSSSTELTENTICIPHLIPAKGDPEADIMWEQYQRSCRNSSNGKPKVDPGTGEVTENPDGTPVKPWDGGQTKLDPLGQLFQQVYNKGLLVTVDETTRIKPLAIPVKAKLLGLQAERTVGAVTQKQSFSLEVLEEAVAKELEKCRRVNDLTDILTYQLSLGHRWIPVSARCLLDGEIEERNKNGHKILRNALKVKDISEHADINEIINKYIQHRSTAIRNDLDKMYKDLGQGSSVPEDKVQEVLAEIRSRLHAALSARITPRVVYNKLAPPDLTEKAPVENWSQPLSLLFGSARLLRKYYSDKFFSINFSKLLFSEQQFIQVMDIFDDFIVETESARRAKQELSDLNKIETTDSDPKQKSSDVWEIIQGPESRKGNTARNLSGFENREKGEARFGEPEDADDIPF